MPIGVSAFPQQWLGLSGSLLRARCVPMLMRVPFSRLRAPSRMQPVIGIVVSELPLHSCLVCSTSTTSYLWSVTETLQQRFPCCPASPLVSSIFLVSPKHILDATHCLSWMGRRLGFNPPHVAHKPQGFADIIGKCLHVTMPYVHAGCCTAPWFDCPRFCVGWFLVGARAWLRLGLLVARCMPFAVCGGLLGAMPDGTRGRELPTVQEHAMPLYTDGAA